MEDSDQHTVSPPFEISQYPIEVKESKDAIHRQLTNRLYLLFEKKTFYDHFWSSFLSMKPIFFLLAVETFHRNT